MDLKTIFHNKLQDLEKRLIKCRQGVTYLQELINNIKRKIKEENTKQIFIRKEIELKQTVLLLKEYANEFSVYVRHKDIILRKDTSTQIAFEHLDELKDKVTDLIATVQSMIVYLEFSEYK